MSITHEVWLNRAAHQAIRSQCLKAQCGAVIVAGGAHVIGWGFSTAAVLRNWHSHIQKPGAMRPVIEEPKT